MGYAPIRCPNGTPGTRAGAMGRWKGEIPDLGTPVLPSRRAATGGSPGDESLGDT